MDLIGSLASMPEDFVKTPTVLDGDFAAGVTGR